MSNSIRMVLLCIFGCTTVINAQMVQCSAVDRADFEKRVERLRGLDEKDPGTAIVAIGKMFLGTPYKAYTLESSDPEQLIVTFQGLDCTTFVENVLAFYMLYRIKVYSFDAFAEQLQKIRYRDGQIDGYPSRLHYFTEWIANNTHKGWLKDVTAQLGGLENTRKRDFMSTHRDAYFALGQEAAYQGILEMEAALQNSTYFVLNKEQIEKTEPALQNGDIIAFATSIDGLDVTHTGLAIWHEDRVHLLHASSSGQVEVSSEPLANYARNITHNTGVIIARVTQ